MNCFWKLCDCPTSTPAGKDCTEHHGRNCSLLNNKGIQKLDDVNDALTARANAMVLALQQDVAKLDRLVKSLEREKERLTRKKNALEQLKRVPPRGSLAKRRTYNRVYNALSAVNRRLAIYRRILQRVNQGIVKPDGLINQLSGRLQIPFVDRAGFCSCYLKKQTDLGKIAGSINAEKIRLARLKTSYAGTYTSVLTAFVVISFPAFITLLKFFGILLLGLGWAGIIAPLIAFLIAVIIIVALLIKLSNLAKLIAASQAKLITLMIAYYRMQQIPVCQKVRVPAKPDNNQDGDNGQGDQQEEPDEEDREDRDQRQDDMNEDSEDGISIPGDGPLAAFLLGELQGRLAAEEDMVEEPVDADETLFPVPDFEVPSGRDPGAFEEQASLDDSALEDALSNLDPLPDRPKDTRLEE